MDSPTNMQDSDGILEIDTLKQFTIPKRKKSKKGMHSFDEFLHGLWID